MILYRRLQLSQMFLVLMMMIAVTQATVRESFFNKVHEDQSIIGKLGAELRTRSKQECALWCLSDDQCQATKYMANRVGNCILIYKNCTKEEGQIFELDSNSAVYVKKETTMSSRTWLPPLNWTGPDAALYYSFDSSDGLILMEGTKKKCAVPIVNGQVNNALGLNRTKNQWVDVGIHTEACMTRPETCGAAGGAISLWVKVIECSDIGGIVSSFSLSTGILIGCSGNRLWFGVYLLGGYFATNPYVPTGWTHFLLKYIGPNGGQGIRIYYDGTEVGRKMTNYELSLSPGDGRIVVGRRNTERDQWYTSVEVDGLIFFNQALTQQEIDTLATAT